MNEYEIIRAEFLELEKAGLLIESVATPVQEVWNGHVFNAGEELQHIEGVQVLGIDPMAGGYRVTTCRRPDDQSVIAQVAYQGGAVDGCTRYFNRQGDLVGEEEWDCGAVFRSVAFA